MNSHETCEKLQRFFHWYAKRRFGLAGDDRDDVVQEALMLMLRNWGKFNGLPQCLKRFALWQLSRARKHVAHQRMIVNSQIRKHLEELARARDAEVNDDVAHREEVEYVSARVRGLLGQLTAPQREATTRVYGLDGPPIQPIDFGLESGISRQAVNQRLNQSLSNLRQFLGTR